MNKNFPAPEFLKRIRSKRSDERVELEAWIRQHDEVAKTIRRVMMVLVGYSLFCLLTLGAPDKNLIAASSTIKIPFANTQVSYQAFLIVGPLILVGLLIYLQIFVGRALALRKAETNLELPFIFNMRDSIPKILTHFLFYWLAPIVLMTFVWKAMPRVIEGYILLALTGFTILILLLLDLQRRKVLQMKKLWHRALIAPISLIVGVTLFYLFDYVSMNHRRLYLAHTNLAGLNLSFANLQNAILADTNLENANLSYARLEGANFYGANLKGADLKQAQMQFTDMYNTDLHGAELTDTQFHGASIHKSNFKGATLRNAQFTHTTIWDSDFRFAFLQDAGFQGAQINDSNFGGSWLKDSNFQGAVTSVEDKSTFQNALALDAQFEQLNEEVVKEINTQLSEYGFERFRDYWDTTPSQLVQLLKDKSVIPIDNLFGVLDCKRYEYCDYMSMLEQWALAMCEDPALVDSIVRNVNSITIDSPQEWQGGDVLVLDQEKSNLLKHIRYLVSKIEDDTCALDADLKKQVAKKLLSHKHKYSAW